LAHEVGYWLGGNYGGQAGCQPAIQPIANRRYLTGSGGFLEFIFTWKRGVVVRAFPSML
jgi:hypothetical protein